MMTLPRTNKTVCGVVEKAIAPHRPGRIKFQGTYWKAELAELETGTIEAGVWVEVVDRRGITLLVVPEGRKISGQPLDFNQNDEARSFLANWIQKFSAALAVAFG